MIALGGEKCREDQGWAQGSTDFKKSGSGVKAGSKRRGPEESPGECSVLESVTDGEPHGQTGTEH